MLVAVFMSPLFRMENIEISGNDTITQNEILNASGLLVGDSMFAFNIGRVARDIADLPFVHSVDISRSFPRSITIDIRERIPAANVYCTQYSAYFIIDNVGMVLEMTQSFTNDLPRLIGLGVFDPTLGQYLSAENSLRNDIVLLLHIFEAYDFYPDAMDFSNPHGILMQYGLFEIDFGNIMDAERKVRYLHAIINNSSHDRGFIDIRNPDSNPRLRLSR